MQKIHFIRLRTQQGLTLIETLSIVAVVSIIGFSTPTLLERIQGSKDLSAIHDFAKVVAFANQQAVKLKTAISLCAANERRSNCSATSNNWSYGYLVKIDTTGEILKALPAMTTNQQLISADSHGIQFSANGLIKSSQLFKLCNGDNTAIRNLIVNSQGEVRSANFTYNGNCTS